MRAWNIVGLNPDRTNLIEGTTIETSAFIKHTTTHSLTLYIVEVASHHTEYLLVFLLLLGEGCDEIGLHLLECSLALVLVLVARLCYVVARLIAEVVAVLLELLVIDFVIIFHNGLANSLHQFLLHLAVNLDSLVSCLESTKQILLGNLFHLTFNHHDVLVGCTYHQVHIGLLHLLEGWIDDIFAIDANNTNFGDWAFERNTTHCHCSRCCETGKCIRLVLLIGTIEGNVDECLSVVVAGEKGTQGTVDETRCEDLIIAGLAFTQRPAEAYFSLYSTVKGIKSVPGVTVRAVQTVARSIVPPMRSSTAPSACFATLPVSRVMVRPSLRVIVFLIGLTKLFTIKFKNLYKIGRKFTQKL